MDRIIKELEKVWHLQSEHENCFGVKVCSKAANEDEGRSSNILNEEFLKIPLSEIRHATNDFDPSYHIGSGGFADIYRAKLDVLGIHSLSSTERKCNEEKPKIRKDT
ncbi:hypothetical protein QVD17_37430 [Tagetes erecta]|uniref:Uncharacterized protein n=1 Tax=Tagetes erecta TaxID=13708 RepID=A0AAD8JVZ8_TARER|nr:hypothetical protein QVD17_37430 [Tagetes erecta]